jgi:putative hemolysin
LDEGVPSSFMGWLLAAIIIYLMIGIFTGFEYALLGTNTTKIKNRLTEENPKLKYFNLILLEQPRVLKNAGFWLGFLVCLYTLSIQQIAGTLQHRLSLGFSLIFILLSLTLIILLFKNLAHKQPENYLIKSFFISVIFARTLNLRKLLAAPRNSEEEEEAFSPSLTQEDIEMIVDAGEEHGVLEEHEKAMIHSIFAFGDSIAKEVMVPRVDMVCIEGKTSLSKFLEVASTHGFSRIPVYEDNIDNILGIVHLKDVLNHIKNQELEIPLKNLCRPAHFIPSSKKLDELFIEMQKAKISIVIVVDEYGGTEGLITMEDLIEEIVGELIDEYDRDSPLSEAGGDGSTIIDAKMLIEDVNELLHINLPSDKYETLGGYLYGIWGRVPQEGETIQDNNLIFTVEKLQRQRIKKSGAERRCQILKLETSPAPAGSSGMAQNTERLRTLYRASPLSSNLFPLYLYALSYGARG